MLGFAQAFKNGIVDFYQLCITIGGYDAVVFGNESCCYRRIRNLYFVFP